ncbi:MAG: peptidylprolyl isomerase [Puniceicoccales bacterium]|jgi:peptidyl-prolyl cis-trans isomerase B (cyclophilin B)|nr:peptidylprolyl isomerase [Puniceicoccales bacterium]
MSTDTIAQKPAPAPETAASNPANSAPKNEVAVLKTNYGDITISFFPEDAPATVENFKELVRFGFYDGTAFHRLIKGFMIQGGCPNTKVGAIGTPGTGGPGHRIKGEFNSRRHVRGVVSMARADDPDSAGSQFFIMFGDAPFLDRKYAAFGEVIAGEDVLAKLEALPVDWAPGGERSKPTARIELISATLRDA